MRANGGAAMKAPMILIGGLLLFGGMAWLVGKLAAWVKPDSEPKPRVRRLRDTDYIPPNPGRHLQPPGGED